LIGLITAEPLYKSIDSNVLNLTKDNWENQVTKSRLKKDVWVVHFYRKNDGQSKAFADDFRKTSENMDGILKFGGIDCDENTAICYKLGVQNYPSVMVYPPQPIPAYRHEGELVGKKIAGSASAYVGSVVEEVTDDNVEGFLKGNAAMPKVFLFTDKASTPLLWKAVSIAFEGKMSFGITRKNESDVVNKFNVKKFPSIVLSKTGDRKPHVYEGALKFKDIFDWANVHSEEFVYGGGSSAEGNGVAPWLNEAVPELHSKSSVDVCLGFEGALCVIMFSDEKPDKNTIDMLKDVRRVYDAKTDRAILFKFMWLNADKEVHWAQKFKHESNPAIYVMNPGRRKRYLTHEGDMSYDSLFNTLEKIVGGDGRFTMVQGNQVPEFVA